jgi:hypothetical protein
MIIREDNVYLGCGKTGSIYHNWDTIDEAKRSGRFDFILENSDWEELDFQSEKDYLTHWNNIVSWEDLLSLSDYFMEENN